MSKEELKQNQMEIPGLKNISEIKNSLNRLSS